MLIHRVKKKHLSSTFFLAKKAEMKQNLISLQLPWNAVTQVHGQHFRKLLIVYELETQKAVGIALLGVAVLYFQVFSQVLQCIGNLRSSGVFQNIYLKTVSFHCTIPILQRNSKVVQDFVLHIIFLNQILVFNLQLQITIFQFLLRSQFCWW